MEYTILDLEWNSVYSRKLSGFFNEIIQFGAVRLNTALDEVGRFSTFVRPVEGTKLTGLVTELTNITNEDVQNGMEFPDAFRRFCDFAAGSVLMTWGDGDMRELIHNYAYYTGSEILPLDCTYVNLQDYCQARLDLPAGRQIGLADAAALIGVPSDALALHRAIDDSVLSAECLRRLMDEAALCRDQTPVDEVFCRRLAFKNRFITDRSSPLIDREQLEFSCPDCGGALNGTGEWCVHNKQFFRRFTCVACEKKFKARVQFKQKYDGIQVRRSISVDRPKEPEAAVHDGV